MPHTLLLADDSVTIQRVIELTFADEDVQVVAVSDGDQAIARIEASPPDIVLADTGMPGTSGYEVAQHVKQSPRLAHIPVILLTGAFEPVDQARAAAAGCTVVLAKPFEPQLVIGHVKELLANGARSAPLPAPAAAMPAQPESVAPTAAPGVEAPPKISGDLDSYFDRLDEAFANLGAPAPAGGSPATPAPVSSAFTSDDLDWFGTVDAPAGDAAAELANVAPAFEAARPDPPLSYASPLVEFDRLGELSPIAPAAPAEPTASPEPSALAASTAPPASTVSAESAPPSAEVDVPPAAGALDAPAAHSVQQETHDEAAPEGGERSTEEAPPSPPTEPLPAPAAAGLPTLADAFAALLAAEQHDTSDAALAWPSQAPGAVVNDQLVDEVAQRVLGQLSDRVVRETVAGLVSTIAERLVREEIERIKASIS